MDINSDGRIPNGYLFGISYKPVQHSPAEAWSGCCTSGTACCWGHGPARWSCCPLSSTRGQRETEAWRWRTHQAAAGSGMGSSRWKQSWCLRSKDKGQLGIGFRNRRIVFEQYRRIVKYQFIWEFQIYELGILQNCVSGRKSIQDCC